MNNYLFLETNENVVTEIARVDLYALSRTIWLYERSKHCNIEVNISTKKPAELWREYPLELESIYAIKVVYWKSYE